MRPSVNYYHYSVFKLLVVNLRTRFGFAVSPKKTGFGQIGACHPCPTSTADPGKRSGSAYLATARKIFRLRRR
jgi:hypothetical protein